MLRCVQLLHAASGVEKGRASKNGMPVEVMGFIVGHLSTDDEHTLCVTDVRSQRKLFAVILFRDGVGVGTPAAASSRTAARAMCGEPQCRRTR
ncbi:MAG: hypothetical protein EOO39_21365 [Cytophagaceae bacterium]|nr:MAG: hypothetical protein EOO39_21365 [Cytophagaceae bacterium]